MDFNLYLAEVLIRERLREAQRLAAMGGWGEPPAPRCRALRAAVGGAMIRAGRWILGNVSPCAGQPGALGR